MISAVHVIAGRDNYYHCDNVDKHSKMYYFSKGELIIRIYLGINYEDYCKACAQEICQKLAPIINPNLWCFK